MLEEIKKEKSNFIKNIMEDDLKNKNRDVTEIITRFPPEPSGFLHVGHAKAINITYGLAEQFGGKYNLRFDDTNPDNENPEYEKSIKEDIKWLGYDWEEREFHASDYFDKLFEFAVKLINKGKAFVCDLTAEEMREYRGSLTKPGKNSPYRDRSISENIDLFTKMKNGEFEDGSKVLRAKIDMSSSNINLRDPVMYRIKRMKHPRFDNKELAIYPSYDFAHGQSDSIEGVTHSLCSLEFENHRPLYDWYIKELEIYPSRQIEFSRLYLTHTVVKKTPLKVLVDKNLVAGWDDPRMPTIRGMRRRGYTPKSIRDFCESIGTSKTETLIEIETLEQSVREDLKNVSPHIMAVIDPVKVIISNYEGGDGVELLSMKNHPKNEDMGIREVPFSKELYIEREDFKEVIDPNEKFFRLAVGKSVKLRQAYIITCTGFKKDTNGKIEEIYCDYHPETKKETKLDGRKIKGIIHWVCAKSAKDITVNFYDKLFTKENPLDLEEGEEFIDHVNEDSLKTIGNVKIEPNIIDLVESGRGHIQFERVGYFFLDSERSDIKNQEFIFNKTVSLRDERQKGFKRK